MKDNHPINFWKNILLKTKVVIKIFLVIILAGCSYQSGGYSPALTKMPPTLPSVIKASTDVVKAYTEQPPLEMLKKNGISLSLNWVYADKFRIVVVYTVTGVVIPQGYQLPCPVLSMSMKDGSGNLYDKYEYGYGDTENLLTNCVFSPENNSFLVTHNFYLPYTIGDKEYNLLMDIIVGGMQVVTDNGAQNAISDYGNFHLEFNVMNNGDLTLEPNEYINFNEVISTLNRIEITPSFMYAYMCINYENQKGWYPEAYLALEGHKIYADPILTFRTDLKNIDLSNWFNQFTSNRCYRFTFPMKYSIHARNNLVEATVALERVKINLLDAATQNDCEFVKTEVQKKYPDLDFICQIDNRDGGYGVLVSIMKTPTGMELVEAQKIAEQGFVSSKDGPWAFSLLLP